MLSDKLHHISPVTVNINRARAFGVEGKCQRRKLQRTSGRRSYVTETVLLKRLVDQALIVKLDAHSLALMHPFVGG